MRAVEGEGEGWRFWTVFTTLEGLAGWEERVGARREVGVRHGGWEGRRNWRERREEEREKKEEGGVEVLVVGEFPYMPSVVRFVGVGVGDG